jgi:histidinol-phosphate/aromatic aminotransferase/cobyric acid decarboxylase-like protein
MAPGDLLDLSQNLNPFAPRVDAVVTRHLAALAHYPDPRPATDLLAARLGVEPERVLLTNGGSEAIHLVAAELGGGVLAEPEFALHPRAATGPRWRSNPHSPSGLLAGTDLRAEVWDEAFYALATGSWTARREGVVVGSLTKTFACPGLRLGYVIARDGAEMQRLSCRQPQWSVGALALACLPDLLEKADIEHWARRIGAARAELAAELVHRGFSITAGDAPWVLVQGQALREQLAPYGVLVRDCASFGLTGTTRIAVPDDRGLMRLLDALRHLGR